MDLKDFLGPKRIVVDLRAKDRSEAINELLDHLVEHKKIKPDDKGTIADAVKKREMSMTTGAGYGIAIPHALTNLVSELVGIIGRSRQGIHFGAKEGKPVNLVFLFLVPRGQFKAYMTALADIAKRLHKKDRGDLGL